MYIFNCRYETFKQNLFKSLHYEKQKDASIPVTDAPNLSRKVNVPLKNCKVVLEDISFHSAAGKHNTLKQCQGNPHTTSSCDSVENKSLQDLTVKRPIT